MGGQGWRPVLGQLTLINSEEDRMNRESKEEACSILAMEYSDIAKASGFDHSDVFKTYMDRCMGRDDETVAEQTMKEAYNMIKKNPNISWVQEWQNEKLMRLEAEERIKTIEVELKSNSTNKDKDEVVYLRNYATNLAVL
jgi:hypothetical protein